MKLVAKVLIAILLTCSIYIVAGHQTVRADDEEEYAGCTEGTKCEKCKCKYNACMDKPNPWPDGCSMNFYYCVERDTSCTLLND